jgi:hypothetical protein
MNRESRTELRRFAASGLIAVPVTMALLFVMTCLILPSEGDQIITRMIQDIEFLRATRTPAPADILVYKPPQILDEERLPTQPTKAVNASLHTQSDKTASEESSEKGERVQIIDWWAAARKLTQESDEEAFKQWLLEQGYERYVSIMQGPLPITNSVQAELPATQEDATGYMNSFGDMEFKISENCVATTQVAARLDRSDFARALPMRITCKPAAKQRFSFDRHDRE